MKIVTLASALVLGASICGAAEAQTRRVPTSYGYVFAEYDYYSATGGSLNGGGIGGGWRFNRYLGAQLGGQYSRKSGVDITNSYLEGLVYLPLASNFQLYGSIGGAYARAEASFTAGTPPTTFKISTSSSGYRAGVGAEYWMGRNWGLRAGFHRQNAGGVADDISVGLALRF
jgi:opacity protein-like surface antigen